MYKKYFKVYENNKIYFFFKHTIMHMTIELKCEQLSIIPNQLKSINVCMH